MKPKLGALALAATGLLATVGSADVITPGSALVYPIHRSGEGSLINPFFTVVSVTNTNVDPVQGATNVQFDYVNTVRNPLDSQLPLDCFIVDRVESLTPADTLSVLTRCHNAADDLEGYLVVTAQDPSLFKSAWSFNHLVGSEFVINASGAIYSLNAIPFSSPVAEKMSTDADMDGQLDFDGVEYQEVPDKLYLDSFLAVERSSLTLINLSGGTQFTALVKFDIFNDNEFPLSATTTFRCWMEERLNNVSLVFDEDFLSKNTPNDDTELDIECDNEDDLETGWAIIDGIVANSSIETIQDPALLGAVTAGPALLIFSGGRTLWGSNETQDNGDFLKFGNDDPEN